MKTVGVLGPITGRGANLFIMDDPIKNDREALSKVYRDHMWDWYRSTVYTRLEPGACIILTMARWHEDDLAGRLISEMDKGGERWTILNLPALAEENDPLGREPGQALWAERYDEEALATIRRVTSEFWWSALYQGKPIPASGGLFKREDLRYFSESKEEYLLHDVNGTVAAVIPKTTCWLFATADLAASTKESADYTVVCVWAVTSDNELLLLDMDRRRLEHPDQVDAIHAMNGRFGYRFASIDIESNQYQLGLVQEAVRKGLPAVGVQADRDKLARALPAANRMAQHTIYLPIDTWWVEDVLGELLVFTGKNDKHDDIVDNFSLAARRIAMGEGDLTLWTSGSNIQDIGYR
jgi:predicted phage terminase large subunit-like protein